MAPRVVVAPMSKTAMATSIAAYFVANPPPAGQAPTDAQVAAQVAIYVAAHPPSSGNNATDAQVASAVATYLAAHPPAAGPSPLVTIGTVTIAQTAVIAISAGIRTITFTGLAGLFTSDNVLLFPVVTAGVGIPDGYAIHNAWCSAAGTLKVALSAPLLAIGASYSIPCRVIVLR
jgi:hypothetical protein